jgi:hypothetical protein
MAHSSSSSPELTPSPAISMLLPMSLSKSSTSSSSSKSSSKNRVSSSSSSSSSAKSQKGKKTGSKGSKGQGTSSDATMSSKSTMSKSVRGGSISSKSSKSLKNKSGSSSSKGSSHRRMSHKTMSAKKSSSSHEPPPTKPAGPAPASSPAPEATAPSLNPATATAPPTRKSIQYNLFQSVIESSSITSSSSSNTAVKNLLDLAEENRAADVARQQQQQPQGADTNSNSGTAQQQQQQTACALNANGFYGSPQGVSYQISYAYQVVVRNGTTETMVSDDVAPVLDTAIAQDVLPYFFPECVPSSTRRGRRNRRKQRQRRRAEQAAHTRLIDKDTRRLQGSPAVLGVSRLQSDFPVSGGTCLVMIISCGVLSSSSLTRVHLSPSLSRQVHRGGRVADLLRLQRVRKRIYGERVHADAGRRFGQAQPAARVPERHLEHGQPIGGGSPVPGRRTGDGGAASGPSAPHGVAGFVAHLEDAVAVALAQRRRRSHHHNSSGDDACASAGSG